MAAHPNGEQVYATLLLTDSYLPGALVLAHSLRDAGTHRKLAVLVTLETVSAAAITQLKTVYDYVFPVPTLRNDHPNLHLMKRPDLHSAFTKINLWRHVQFSKIVYIDADVVAYRAPDELFDIPHAFSAAPDIGWPDIFNTGVMVLTPNMGDYYAMMAMAERGISFDGADQGLLNMHFRNTFNRLSFSYNVTPSAHYQYIPAYRHFQSSISMVHFIGSNKPWLAGRSAPQTTSPYNDMVGRWWAVHDRHYRSQEKSSGSSAPISDFVKFYSSSGTGPRVASQGVGARHQDSQPGSSYSHPHSVHQHSPLGAVTSTSSRSPPAHGPAIPNDQGQVHGATEQFEGNSPGAMSHSVGPSHQVDAASASREEQHAPAGTPPPRDEPSRDEPSQGEPPQVEPPREPSPVPVRTWDAQWHPPPSDSKPEAMNFPQTHYEMSRDTKPFVAPIRYPSPPKNMWYEVPKEPPAPSAQPARAIFPWEGSQPPASRVFPTDPSTLQPTTAMTGGDELPSANDDPATISPQQGADEQPSTPTTPTIKVTPSDPWTSFTRVNAWDDVPEISRYVDGLQKHQRGNSRGKISGVGPTTPEAGTGARRRGFKLTDFPTEVERPSLPVTPAPIRGSTAWGREGTAEGDENDGGILPAAEGVPAQAEWVCAHGRSWGPADCLCDLADLVLHHKDPAAQLQKLAKLQSEMLLRKLGGEGPNSSPHKEIPLRHLPFGSQEVTRSSPPVLSPRPMKMEAASRLVRGIGSASTPGAAVSTGASGLLSESPMPKPSRSGI